MFKNTLIYILSSILSGAIPFFLLPILTRYLSPVEYGQIAMFTIFTTALAAVVGLSVHGAAGRRFFDVDVTEYQLARFNGNCFFILLISTFVLFFALVVFDDPFARYLGIPIGWIYLGILSVFFRFLLNIRLGQWQARGKAKAYGTLQVLTSLIVFLFSLLFVISFKLGPEGRIDAIVLTAIIAGVISVFTLRKDKLLRFEYSKEDIKDALSFGVPLIPHAVGGFLLLSVDRLVINKELGLGMTGIYMVALNLGNALNILFNSINRAYSPWLFGQLKENDQNIKLAIVKKTYVYFIFLIVMSILAYFIAPPILKLIVGEKFHQAADVLPIIIFGQVFLGMYFMVTNYIFYVKKTKYLSYATISSGAINVGLLLVLIPIYGIYGAAIAFMSANCWQFICTWYISSKIYVMPWSYWRK